MRLQKKPDPPEALDTIPVLKIADLERENKTIPLTRLRRKGPTILFHDLFTNGITYLDIGFDLHNLPINYLQYLPLFGRNSKILQCCPSVYWDLSGWGKPTWCF